MTGNAPDELAQEPSRGLPAGVSFRIARPGRGLLGLLLGADVGRPAAEPAPPAVPAEPGRAAKVRLFGLSFLMLFVELALIRWTGAKIVYLSYFSNFVLLGSFLGIGLGFLRARSRLNLFPWAARASPARS